MPAILLPTKYVAKPWGRRVLGHGFGDVAADAEPIGEVWFPPLGDADSTLLIKYLFTSEKLSIQVHPDDDDAAARGHPRGKDEAWLILSAEPDSVIALGPKRDISAEQLRTAALDGSIVDLLDWRPVKAGDFIYSPAGTIHAIGAGLTVIEVQQNVDLTYRLFDYGRPRELHLQDGVAVSTLLPFGSCAAPPKFSVDRIGPGDADVGNGWCVPVLGGGTIDGKPLQAGQCWFVRGSASVSLTEGSMAIIARPTS